MFRQPSFQRHLIPNSKLQDMRKRRTCPFRVSRFSYDFLQIVSIAEISNSTSPHTRDILMTLDSKVSLANEANISLELIIYINGFPFPRNPVDSVTSRHHPRSWSAFKNGSHTTFWDLSLCMNHAPVIELGNASLIMLALTLAKTSSWMQTSRTFSLQ